MTTNLRFVRRMKRTRKDGRRENGEGDKGWEETIIDH
jgi:hypothetical protein